MGRADDFDDLASDFEDWDWEALPFFLDALTSLLEDPASEANGSERSPNGNPNEVSGSVPQMSILEVAGDGPTGVLGVDWSIGMSGGTKPDELAGST